MSVTVNNTGPASRQIVVLDEVTSQGIIAGINTALIALGWTLFDSATSGSRGMLTTKVYSAVNNDNATTPTTKYMILRYDLPKAYFYVSCCESWDAVNKLALNESSLPKTRSFPIPLQQSSYTLYIFASARYAAFMPVLGQEPGMWQGVFEFEREATEDITDLAIPCFGWTSAVTLGANYGNAPAATGTYGAAPQVFSVPRDRLGNTGVLASQRFAISTAFGVYPPPKDIVPNLYTAGGLTTAIAPANGMLQAFGTNLSYTWNVSKRVISNLKLTGIDAAYVAGRLYGLKVIPSLGNALDTVSIPIDSSGFFVDSGGVSTSHIMLTLPGGYPDTNLVAANRLIYTLLNSGPATAVAAGMVLKGTLLYYVTGSQLRKASTITGFDSLVATLPSAGNDLIFDGTNTLYISTASGVSRLIVSTEVLTNLDIAGGIASLGIDDNFLYGAYMTVSTTPALAIIDLGAFSLTRTYTSTFNTTTACRFTGIFVSDYTGAVITTNLGNNIAAAANYKAWRILGADASGAVSSFAVSVAASLTLGTSAHYDGTALWLCGSDNNAYAISVDQLTLLATVAMGAISTTGGTVATFISPVFRGMFALTNNATAAHYFTNFRHGQATGATLTASSVGSALTGAGNNAVNVPSISDGISLYRCNTGNAISKFSSQYIGRSSIGTAAANILLPF
jgi:hypothetical protein